MSGLSWARMEMRGRERISYEAEPEAPGEAGGEQAGRGRRPWSLAGEDRAGTREASSTGPVCLCSPDHVHWRPIPLPIWGRLRTAVSQGARDGYGSSGGVQGWSEEQRGLTEWRRVCLTEPRTSVSRAWEWIEICTEGVQGRLPGGSDSPDQ